ncbi:hypothetical protein AKJ09_09776 [Labilithrix luteola]|uniref:Uncharacterized protein n=1 Tax=Labilithrix luteola TaxID=1391654 RepID=A0A0K1QBK3_9BACT|nr:hypothetical protein AKJ09_09776 [Labilithrix luteola]
MREVALTVFGIESERLARASSDLGAISKPRGGVTRRL